MICVKNEFEIRNCVPDLSKNYLSIQVKEEHSVSGSDEEVDDPPEVDSDEDLSDGGKHTHEEVSRTKAFAELFGIKVFSFLQSFLEFTACLVAGHKVSIGMNLYANL